MSERELTKDESLALISDMIGQAKRNIARGGSFHFLLWGWVVMLANLGHFILGYYELVPFPYIVWLATIPTAFVSFFHGKRTGSKQRARGHLDRVYGLIWLGVTINVIVMIVFMQQIGHNLNAVILTFAALGTFINGTLLRFRPLILGAVALWISSIVAFNMSPVDQYLVGAIGIFAGYLVPGYLLKRAEREQV